MLVLAGPGSGKTTVISERVRYLIEEKCVAPERILTITFTKAAALEMQGRCQKICPRAGNAVFGTFHSVFYHILRKSEKYQKFSVINEKEKKEMMQKIIPVGNRTQLQHAYLCESTLKKISFFKNSSKIENAEEEEAFLQIMERYCTLCEENQKLDFDDMLVLCRRLLEENAGERRRWQERFDYILVDEFQDINRCQYEIVKLLAQKKGNLFVVGDDDQAIYSFRGSDPGFMKQFLADYPESRQVCLEENYRSGAEIVDLAGRSICCNEDRFEKHVRATATFEHRVQIRRFDTVLQEIHTLADQIKSEGKETAVLVRTNMQAEYIAEVFSQKGIKCVFREKRKCFYENVWVQDILAILRFAACGQKRSDFLVFMNKPFRGIGRSMLRSEHVDLKCVCAKEEGTEEIFRELNKMEHCIKLMRGMDPYGAIMLALHGLNYRSYLETFSEKDENIKVQTEEVLEELLMRARAFDSIAKFLQFVKSYTEGFHLQEVKEEGDGVHILTYHASKGLEFDRVYLPMLTAGSVPRGHVLSREQTQEERRMFYVAMTRARCFLQLSWHGKEDGSQASIFLKELENEKIGT